MNKTTILFDLDGTLLPMDQNIFANEYFTLMAKKMAAFNYEPKQLIDSIWKATVSVVKNNGDKTNYDVFWDEFSKIYTDKVFEDLPTFNSFYEVEFQNVQKVCGFDERAAVVIKKLKEMGFNLILATNPIFPRVATESRVRWAGLDKEDFDLITTYENSSFCKPNPSYYEEILNKFNLKPEECLMVGNDVVEDMVAKKLGIDVFLLTDCLINKNNEDINNYPNGSFEELLEYIKN